MGCLRGAATARELAVRFTPSAKRGLFLLIPDGSETRIIAQPTRSRGTRRTDCPVHRGQEVTAGTAPPPGSCFPCSTFEHPDDRWKLSESRACRVWVRSPARRGDGGAPCGSERARRLERTCETSEGPLALSLTQATLRTKTVLAITGEARRRPGGARPPGVAGHGSSERATAPTRGFPRKRRHVFTTWSTSPRGKRLSSPFHKPGH